MSYYEPQVPICHVCRMIVDDCFCGGLESNYPCPHCKDARCFGECLDYEEGTNDEHD